MLHFDIAVPKINSPKIVIVSILYFYSKNYRLNLYICLVTKFWSFEEFGLVGFCPKFLCLMVCKLKLKRPKFLVCHSLTKFEGIRKTGKVDGPQILSNLYIWVKAKNFPCVVDALLVSKWGLKVLLKGNLPYHLLKHVRKDMERRQTKNNQ